MQSELHVDIQATSFTEGSDLAGGGKPSSRVAKSTSVLVAGAEPGPSKIVKVSKFGIPVIDEDAFLRLLSRGERSW